MEEIFDVVDAFGNPTGETVPRSKAHSEGFRHRTAHIWVMRRKDNTIQFLLQKRSMDKDSFPGQFDTSSAGHIHAGDEPLSSALRELEEELGIHAKEEDLKFAGTFDVDLDLVFHNKPFRDKETAFVYVLEKDVEPEELVIQTEELDEVRWFDASYAYEATVTDDPRFCIPPKGIETAMRYLGLLK